jgi:hypoxanthine phosphoribosyltransferase
MSNKLSLSWQDVEHLAQDIVRDIHLTNWRPDIVIGIDRGGLIPSTMLSHYLEIPHESVKVSLRDNPQTESLLWAPEEAIAGRKILLVDDINDSGATQKWLMDDWAASVAGVEADFVAKYWHNTVRFAALVDNEASDQYTDYCGMIINKAERDVWIDFPWESWWTRSTYESRF